MRLQRLLGGEDAARLRRRLRERLARGGNGPITLSRASDTERATVERLLGRPPRRGTSLRVDPDDVASTLTQAGIAPDLTTALEALDGPIRDTQAERAATAQRWQAVFDGIRERADDLGLSGWIEALESSGLLKRLSRNDPNRAEQFLTSSLDVIEQLPGQGINRASLAARCLGDAHGLDRGQPVTALVRQALQSHWGGGIADPEADERTIWAHGGVLIGGDISSTILGFRLPVTGDGPTADMLTAQNAAGEPVYLTLRQLLRQPPLWDVTGTDVFVCENPTVLAEAAERLGHNCAPIIATNGQPHTACLVLLEALTNAGARLHVRADFDWPGVSIVNRLLQRFPMTPWRMDSATLDRHTDLGGRPLRGPAVHASWDNRLSGALQQHGRILEEEQLLRMLLEDLNAGGRPQRGRT